MGVHDRAPSAARPAPVPIPVSVPVVDPGPVAAYEAVPPSRVRVKPRNAAAAAAAGRTYMCVLLGS